MSSIEKFTSACKAGDEEEVKRLVGLDPALLNQQGQNGWTGLMRALCYGRHSVSRWLLGETGLDVAVSADDNRTALHYAAAAWCNAPLDIVVRLAQLSSQQTINQQDRGGRTALDLAWAVQRSHKSAALYLSWLGAACKPENKRTDPVTVHTWIQEGLAEAAQLWALAAKDTEALKLLARMDEVTIEWERLRKWDEVIFNGKMSLALFHLKNPLVKFYEEEIDTNFQVVCQGQVLRCHKEILAARSKFFRRLIDTDLPGSKEKLEMVVCPDPEVAVQFIRYFYTGQVPKGMEEAQVTDPSKFLKNTGEMNNKVILHNNLVLFLKLSDFYDVAELKEIVEDAMIEKLDKENYEELLVGATVHGLHGGRRVKAAVAKFLSQNPAVFEELLTKYANML